MSVLLTWDQTSFQGVNTTFTWNGAPNDPLQPNYTWDDVQLIIRAAGDDYNQWENKDKNKFPFFDIQLLPMVPLPFFCILVVIILGVILFFLISLMASSLVLSTLLNFINLSFIKR